MASERGKAELGGAAWEGRAREGRVREGWTPERRTPEGAGKETGKELGKGGVEMDQERAWKKSRLRCIPAAAVFRFASVEPYWLPAAPYCPCPCPGRRGPGTSGP
jgi:hypothetical protein